ncbi:hypothetical protein D3C86_1709810 [compost metagenome]
MTFKDLHALDSVQPRHLDVQQDDVHRLLAVLCHGLHHGTGLDDRIHARAVSEQQLEPGAEQGVVIDQQQAGTGHGGQGAGEETIGLDSGQLVHAGRCADARLVRKDYWHSHAGVRGSPRGRIPRLVHTTLDTHSLPAVGIFLGFCLSTVCGAGLKPAAVPPRDSFQATRRRA